MHDNGLMDKACRYSPCSAAINALVPPQPGQGKPVNNLNGHGILNKNAPLYFINSKRIINTIDATIGCLNLANNNLLCTINV